MTIVMETLTDSSAPQKSLMVAVVGFALAFEMVAFVLLGMGA